MQLDSMMEAIEVLARERGVAVDAILDAFANALVAAYKRSPGAAEEARVTIDPESGEVTVYAQELDEDGNVIDEWEDTPEGEAFGRIAAQSFKQVMQFKLREAKREKVFEMYEGREGDLVTGIVQQVDYRSVILDLGDAEAILPGSERIPFERLDRGNRVKALILEVRNEPKGSQIVVSRSHPDLVRRLLELEVPELSDGTVEIVNIAREPGHRTKIAVISHDPNVDPKGACVGARGSRVRQVVNELRGEKVDVVQWRDDVAQFIAEALGPAKVKEVQIDEEEKTANVIVSEHQLSLAIGKEGQNARLAARLSGYKVDIRSDNEGVEPEAPEAPPADGGDTAEADTVDSTADSDAAMASSAADSETDTVDSTADTDTAMAASAADAETDEADDAETDEADDGAEMIVAEIPTEGAADDENSDDEDSIEDSGPDTESE
jgi:N utilization substance protein A